MMRRQPKTSKVPAGQAPPSPTQITHPFPSSPPDPDQWSPGLAFPSPASSSATSPFFPPQTPDQMSGTRRDADGLMLERSPGPTPSPGSTTSASGGGRRGLTASQSAYTGGGYGFPTQSQVVTAAQNRQAGYYDSPREGSDLGYGSQYSPSSGSGDQHLQNGPHTTQLPTRTHTHTQSIAKAPVPTHPAQWRRQGLRPSASVMSLSLMRKASPSTSTDIAGEINANQTPPLAASGQASPTTPMTPSSGTSGESEDHRHGIPGGGLGGGGGMSSSVSMRHFLLKPGNWFGMGKGKGRQKDTVGGGGEGLLAPPEKRARGGSSRPEAIVMGLGLGIGTVTGIGMGMGMGPLAENADRGRYPMITSTGTPERRRAESLAASRRSPGRMAGGSPGSPLASDFAIGTPPSPGLVASATVTGGSADLSRPVPSPSIASPSSGPIHRRGTVGSDDAPSFDDANPVSPIIPMIRLAAASQQSAFRFKTQPLSPPSMDSYPDIHNQDMVQTTSAPTSKCPSPEPPVGPMDSQESIPLPRPSGDVLRSGGGGLLAASRKPWSKSVDDLGRLFGRAPKQRQEVAIVDVAPEVVAAPALQEDAPVPPPSARRMSWNAKQMLRDVSARDQAEKGARQEDRSRRISGNVLPGTRRKTNSFSGNMISSASMSLTSALMGGPDEQEASGTKPRYRAMKMSSPPTLMRSGGGGLSSSSSSPMLSTFAEAASEAETAGTTNSTQVKIGTPMRTELAGKAPEATQHRGHGRSASGGNLLMMPFLRNRNAGAAQPHAGATNPTKPVPPEMSRSDSLAPSITSKRLSQIVHMEGFVLRHSGGTMEINKSDDYFRPAHVQAKAWKPFRMMLKGNILHLYKPSPEQKLALEGAFPMTNSVEDLGKQVKGPYNFQTPPNALRGKRPKPSKPILAIPIADSRATAVLNPIRPYLFSLVTAEGAKHILQSTSSAEMETWIFSLNKTSEEAMLRRQTYLPPMGVPELKRESMTSAVDHRSTVFGVDLATLLEEENARAESHEHATVPWIAEACMKEIEKRADETGLYRLAGSLVERKKLQRDLDTGRAVDLSIDGRYPDINTVTGVFKAWMSSLPDAVICSVRYYEVIAAMRIPVWDQRTLAVREILRQLPQAHFDLLHRIVIHLERLLEHEDENRMTPYNFAMCLAPCMLRAPGGSDVIFSDLGPACKLIMELMQYYREILGEDAQGAGSAPPSPALPTEETMGSGI